MKDLLFFLRLFRTERRWMIAGAGLMLLTLLASIALLALSGWFITAAALAGIAAMSLNFFTPGASIRLFAILRTVSRYAERLVTHNATFRLLSRLRVWFFERAIPLAPARLGGYRSGDLLNRITADIDALDNLYIRVLAPTVVAAVLGLLLLVAASMVAPVIAVTVLALLIAAGVGGPMIAGRLGAPIGREMTEIASTLRTRVVDGIQGLAELKVFQADRRHSDALAADTERLLDRQRGMSRITGLSGALTMALTSLAVIAVLYLGIDLLRGGALSGPQLAMLTFATMAAFEAVAALPVAYQYLGRTRAAARRLLDIADAAPTVEEPAQPADRPDRFDLVFDDVAFAYPSTDADASPALAVDGFDLRIDQGARVAVLGASGAGKSTLINLALRFWDPIHGEIRVGGTPLPRLAQSDLHGFMAVLSQRTELFNATIRDNLLIARPDADDDTLWDALETARLADFIRSLPDGLDSWVGESGVLLSGGQARRAALARAVLKDAPILLLDEPTEGLDTQAQQQIMAALPALMRGRSVLMITHRMTGLEDFDEILMLDQGRVIERGAQTALLAQRGAFARLYERSHPDHTPGFPPGSSADRAHETD